MKLILAYCYLMYADVDVRTGIGQVSKSCAANVKPEVSKKDSLVGSRPEDRWVG
jgi:hypothetical protein